MSWKRVLAFLRGERRSTEEGPWIESERTQLTDGASDASPIQIIVGLDFGTSFTKVVLGESRVRFAVPFGEFSQGTNPYLLPSVVSTLGLDGRCTLGVRDQVSEIFDDLKMPLIDGNFEDEIQVPATAFLSLVFRYTREWFFSTQGHIYKNREIRWFVNIGLPTDTFDNVDLRTVYLNITRAAWHSSVTQGPISLTRCAETLSAYNKQGQRSAVHQTEGSLPYDRINAFPEFAAQLTGYTRSPRHLEDLHAMIDVGGGTLDVTVFNVVQRKGEYHFPIFARTVQPLGPRYLVRHRLDRLGIHEPQGFSPFEKLPPDKEFARSCRTSVLRIAEIDKPFQREFREFIGGPLLYTKQRRHPKSRHWKSGIPTFFCGGATASEFYASLLGTFMEP